MIYKGVAFKAYYIERPVTEEEMCLQEEVNCRRKLEIELDSWIRRNSDPHLNLENKTTRQFIGWAVENKKGDIEAIVLDAHAYIDSQIEKRKR